MLYDSKLLLSYYFGVCKCVKSNKEGKDQESIQSSTTPDPGYQWKSNTSSQLEITNESQEVSPFPAGDHNATINRRAQKHKKHMTEITVEYWY